MNTERAREMGSPHSAGLEGRQLGIGAAAKRLVDGGVDTQETREHGLDWEDRSVTGHVRRGRGTMKFAAPTVMAKW